MEEEKVGNEEEERVLTVSEGDIRERNRQLAIKMLVRELKKLDNEEVNGILKRWKVQEVEQGNNLSLGIDFPDDVERHQWFYAGEQPVLKHIMPVQETK